MEVADTVFPIHFSLQNYEETFSGGLILHTTLIKLQILWRRYVFYARQRLFGMTISNFHRRYWIWMRLKLKQIGQFEPRLVEGFFKRCLKCLWQHDQTVWPTKFNYKIRLVAGRRMFMAIEYFDLCVNEISFIISSLKK